MEMPRRTFLAGRKELSNLRADLSETHNPARKEFAMATRLAAMLDRRRRKSGALMPQKNLNADSGWPGWEFPGEKTPAPPDGCS
jgi:hypothetical protein